MTGARFWQEFESGRHPDLKLVRFCVLAGGVAFLIFTGILQLSWPQQLILDALIVPLAIWMDRSSSSYLVTLTLMLVSMFSTLRYGYWRLSTTVHFFTNPNVSWTALDAFFISFLVLAEVYSFSILFLGYLQTLWPLRRTPVPLPDSTDDWPAVDVLIPTYNESLSVVRYSALAAINIDWPAEKLNVYILDDGKRPEFRAFAEEAGIGYMTRDDNKHAKAGNINRALARLDSPFVCVFDCDHVPTRSFLQVTIGWFLRDGKLGMLQTPHHFYSPDPFERNLQQFRTIPNEGELFYGIVQDGNDFWNATFFCGSCAVLRRSALDEIGGIAVETVTEDAHTSLRMQINGWNTAYINIPQAAGLATERLSGHVKQRIRWARGMIQILRTDNPLFARGLKPAQRLCYFNAMSHFLYAFPRLVFMSAPLIYLLLGQTNVPGYWAAILAYAFPHLVLSNMTNSRVQGAHRHSFWNEIYETVLAPYIFLPTMLALVNPKLGSFNVTAKGGVVNRTFFDSRIAAPYLLMLGLNVLGILAAIPRYFQFPSVDVAFPLNLLALPINLLARMHDTNHLGTIVMNVIWTFFNIVILGAAIAVAREQQQRRQSVRVDLEVPGRVTLPNGTAISGSTVNMSTGGLKMKLVRDLTLQPGQTLNFTFPVLDGEATLPATVVECTGPTLRAQFDPLQIHQEEALTMLLYSRADSWLGWGEAREADRPLSSLARIVRISMGGLRMTAGLLVKHLARAAKPRRRRRFIAQVAPRIAPLFLLVLAAAPILHAQAATDGQSFLPPSTLPQPLETGGPAGLASAAAAKPVPPGSFDTTYSLGDIDTPDAIVMRGVDAFHTVNFSIPQTQVVKTARVHLRYHFSPALIPSLSHLKIMLNGAMVATLPVTAQPTVNGEHAQGQTAAPESPASAVTVTRNQSTALLETDLLLPAEMLLRSNQLQFEFIGHYTLQCEDPSNTTLWSQIDATSTVELSGALLPLGNDLKLLPLPFYDSAVNLHPSIPIVFLGQPSLKAMQAAGMVASWFGILTDYRAVRFPVSFGSIPQGNVVVISENSAELPAAFNVNGSSGASVAIRNNPNDPYSKMLVVSGDNQDDLLTAAMALTLQRGLFQGDQVRIPSLKPPAPRDPDDAPRWLRTDRVVRLGDLAQTGDLQSDGSTPLRAYMRLPPDLFYGNQQDIPFHLGYRYNGIPIANDSSLQIYMNDAYVSSTPLPHSDKASAKLDTILPIPVSNMRPFSNSLMMQFIFLLTRKGRCQDTAPYNLKGVVMKDSYLDIRDIPHWAVLPNLELFSNAGFPFTRKADLADTVVVLPDTPTADEIEMYLTMMGHFGAQTGYPVLNVSVTNNDGMKTEGTKDYLVLGTVEDQPALSRLNSSLPVIVDGSGLHIQDTQGFFAPLQHAWWKVRSSDHIQSGQLETAGGLPDALIEGMEWPSGSGRSVVIMAVRDHATTPNFLSTFLKTSQSSDVSQSVSVLHGTRFVSYRIGNDNYNVGSISLWAYINLLFSRFPWLVVIAAFIVSALIATLLRAVLRRHARARLQGV